MEPFEIVAAPYTAYVAPTGTAAPAIDDAEGAFDPGWFKLGTSGDRNYTDAGVTVNVNQTQESFRPAGGTLVRKRWRTEEDVMVALVIADLTVEQFAMILDDATITTVAAASGVAGEKSMSLIRGVQVAEFALLVRGLSPYDEDLNAQYELTRVSQDENQAPTYNKAVAELACQWSVLDTINGDDPALYRAQTDPPT